MGKILLFCAPLALAVAAGARFPRSSPKFDAVTGLRPHAEAPAREVPSVPATTVEFAGEAAQAFDAERAIEEALRLPRGEERDGVLRELAYQAAVTRPAEAVALAAELNPSEERDQLMAYVAAQWVSVDAEAAFQWAGQLSGGPLRDRVMAMLATALAERDPLTAAGIALVEVPAGRLREDAVVGVVQRWTQQDPEAAAAWVSAFPEGSLRQAACENLAGLWAGADANAAGAWLLQLQTGPSRDRGMAAYANALGWP